MAARCRALGVSPRKADAAVGYYFIIGKSLLLFSYILCTNLEASLGWIQTLQFFEPIIFIIFSHITSLFYFKLELSIKKIACFTQI